MLTSKKTEHFDKGNCNRDFINFERPMYGTRFSYPKVATPPESSDKKRLLNPKVARVVTSELYGTSAVKETS